MKCFYIKFGDATSADDRWSAYNTDNPTFGFATNRLSPTEHLAAINANGKAVRPDPKIGKYLEYTCIRFAGAAFFHEGTEWHRLVLKDGQDINVLRQSLCDLLALFPSYDWVHKPRSQAVAQFENVISQTWWVGTGIAEFWDDQKS